MTSATAAREPVLETLGTDYYLLAPGDYSNPNRRNFIPPEVVSHVGNAILLAFAGGLMVALTEGAKTVGKTVGSWVSDRMLKLLGKKAKTEDRVTDKDVDEAIKQLGDLVKQKGLKPEALQQTEAAVADTLQNAFGLTPKKARDVAASARASIQV